MDNFTDNTYNKMNRLLLLQKLVTSSKSYIQTLERVIIERREQVAILWLNSPVDNNAMSIEMIDQLFSSLANMDKEEGIKVIVLRSKLKKVFSSGGDIKRFANSFNTIQTLIARFERVRVIMRNAKKPIISVIQGYALGGGFQIAMMSDLIICSKDAHFGLPEIKIGIIPCFGGTQALPRTAKINKAMSMILTGETINAYEANRLNIAMLFENNFQQSMESFIDKLVNKPLKSLLLAKKAIKLSSQTTTEEGLAHEADLYPRLMGQQGSLKGVSAFIEKREPKYEGM